MLTKRITITLAKLHKSQKQIEDQALRFNVLACGRRFGKDVFLMNKLIEPALEGYPVGWGAPSYRMLLENWRVVDEIVTPIIKRRNKQEKQFELITGGLIDFWSLDKPDPIRGKMYKRFIINEGGVVANLLDTYNYIIRPTLADLEGDLYVGGTPKGHNGFWTLYQRGADDYHPNWSSYQFSSYENPYIPPAELDELKNTLPERVFLQEIMAQFIDDAGGVFRGVAQAATAQEIEEALPILKEDGSPRYQKDIMGNVIKDQDGEPIPVYRQYVAGVDVATQVDFTVVSVLDVESREMVYMDRFNRVNYTTLEERLEAIYNRYKLSAMIIESNSIGQSVIEEMVERDLNIIPFVTTNATKQVAIQELQAAFEHNRIKILPDPTLINELQSFESKKNPSGSFSYAAPDGMHDDTVMSLALAYSGLEQGESFILFEV